MNDQNYKTSDFNLACYIYSKGVPFIKIEADKANKQRCHFIFKLTDSINFDTLLKEWESSDTNDIREVLHKSRLLKAELSRFYNKPLA